jgi:hypothetical protein
MDLGSDRESVSGWFVVVGVQSESLKLRISLSISRRLNVEFCSRSFLIDLAPGAGEGVKSRDPSKVTSGSKTSLFDLELDEEDEDTLVLRKVVLESLLFKQMQSVPEAERLPLRPKRRKHSDIGTPRTPSSFRGKRRKTSPVRRRHKDSNRYPSNRSPRTPRKGSTDE